ncbi:MAG: peptidase [Synechococcales cyanobacterium C42_A2020_086]|nr:peptidase [Synechococcales cyanobacterium C42_A2020_086]
MGLGIGLGIGWAAEPGRSQALSLPTAAPNMVSASMTLPPLQAHPLPPALAQWQDSSQQGDYFDAIQPTPAGYLIWSQFPVRVYVQSASPEATPERFQMWLTAVNQALTEWTTYVPLQPVDTPDAADITIWNSAPPLQGPIPLDTAAATSHPSSLVERLPRVRAAETRYEFRIDSSDGTARLSHRFTIYLSPNQTDRYIQATARHELGHALGIWGHSPSPTDALYFSQVREPPAISVRDINTLKRIYEQPTRLGWTVSF